MSNKKFIPFLFSTPMVQAINNGTKSKTRRLVKHKHKIEDVTQVVRCLENESDWGKFILTDEFGEDFLIESPAKIGDVIWLRETFCYVQLEHAHVLLEGVKDRTQFVYKANVHPDWMEFAKEMYKYKWKPSLFMPKSACRTFLEVVNVEVEQLQDISEQDAVSEGINYVGSDLGFGTVKYKGHYFENYGEVGYRFLKQIDSFKSLWISINGKESWDSNPWVWVYTFKIIPAPAEFYQ